MIPKYLKINNFMCYRQKGAEIDFGPLDLTVISGHNGSGKSALIDAITWVLWGRTRAVSSDDNAVISEGQDEAQVIFDFTVSGAEYRVVRRRRRGKGRSADKTTLDFYIKQNDDWSNISEDTVTKTGIKIAEVLRLSYETFTASAFLRQGHAADFTEKKPAERKNVLSQILGLEIYDKYAQEAKENALKLKNDIATLEGSLDTLRIDAVERDEIEKILLEAQAEAKNKAELAKQAENAYQLLTARLASYNQLVQRYDDCLSALAENARSRKNLLEQITDATQKALFAKETLDKEQEIRRGESQRQTIEKLLAEQQVRYEQHERLQKEVLVAQGVINEKKSQIEAYIVSRKEEKKRLQDSLQQEDLQAKLTLAQEDLKIAQETQNILQQDREKLLQAIGESEKQRSAAISSRDQARQDYTHLQENHEHGCPLCHQQLSHTQRQNLLDSLFETITIKETEIAALDGDIVTKKYALQEKNEILSQAEKSCREYATQAAQIIGRIDESNTQRDKTIKSISILDEKIEKYSTALHDEAYSLEFRENLKEATEKLQLLGYSTDEHKTLLASYEQLKQYQSKSLDLKYAAISFKEAQKQEENARTTLEQLEKQTIEKEALRDSLQKEIEDARDISKQTKESQEAYTTAQKQADNAQNTVAVYENRLSVAIKKQEKAAETEKLISHAQTQKAMYDTLQKAFGRNGIQAMIMEMVVPEISEEANRILLRMTDGRLNVSIETQKATKTTGEIRDTLDIVIGDELGTRNYEMYSGGEKFRIDFAIRIALSKVLAGRSGAPLPIVIIDEGFGTQDQNGIEHLKEAIAAISGDFEKIFIITHIEELKEFFPSRINVRKEADGSVVEVE